MRSRSYRRAMRDKKVAQALRSRVCENDLERAKRLADNLAICSCSMCRNPRRSSFHKGVRKLTLQERKAQGSGSYPCA